MPKRRWTAARGEVGRTSWLLDALRSAEIDGAILVCKTCPVGTQLLVLDEMTFHLVIPASWQERFDGASLDQLAHVPWIRMAERSGHQEILQDILRKTKIKPIETVEADHEQLMRALVAAGVGVGLLREALAQQAKAAGELVYFGEHRATTHLAFACAGGRGDDPAIQALVSALKEVWGPEDR